MQQLVRKGQAWHWMLTVCLVLALGYLGSCSDENPYDPYANFDHEAQAKLEDDTIKAYLSRQNITTYTRTSSGLYHVVLQEGTGARPVAGQEVEVTYIGRFVENGVKFDSSFDQGKTFKFTVGQGVVIKGWDEGLPLMRKGEKALLLIPSRIAYGLYGRGSIPGNTPLMFEIQLINL
ncbi:MAG: FKBP-type peptidyl-prolyl cis-trans isomerase [Rufibacter sp.]